MNQNPIQVVSVTDDEFYPETYISTYQFRDLTHLDECFMYTLLFEKEIPLILKNS